MILLNSCNDSLVIHRQNVREIDIEFGTGNLVTTIRLSNNVAQELVREIIRVLGVKVLFTVEGDTT